MIRVIALITAGFLFLSTMESFAFFWLAGRWFISSRYATLTLGVVKGWLDRGIISSSTRIAKVFINRYGKLLLLTLALSEVIPEVQDILSSSQYCYIPSSGGSLFAGWSDSGSLSVHAAGGKPQNFYTFTFTGGPCYSGSANIPAVEIRRWGMVPSGRYEWFYYATVPAPGTYNIGACQVTFSLRNAGSVCPSDVTQAPGDLQRLQQRRRVPVRVYPNPADFLRPDVIESDPALRWLGDEYQRIASDSSIPTITSDALSGVDLPEVGWTIPPEEAIDHTSESSQSGSGSQSGSQEGSQSDSQDASLSVPGFDTSLPSVDRRPFPVELVNSIVQSHPLLRVFRDVNVDVGSGGSCVMGSRPFEFDFCQFGWVLNLMGGLIVFISFLTGLFWAGRSE